MAELNEFLGGFLRDFLFGLGFFTLLLLAIRLLPDFARNLTLLLASVAAIEIFTSPFFTFGLIATTGLIYYGLFWLQWNSRKALFCRMIMAAMIAVFLVLMIFLGRLEPSIRIDVPALGITFLTLRLLQVANSIGRGEPLPTDPLEFFVYAFFFPTFFLGPLERLDEFRKNLVSASRPSLSWKETGLRLIRIVLGLAKIWLVVRFLENPFLNIFLGLSGIYDVILGCMGLVGYRPSPRLDAFPQGTLVSKSFLMHVAVIGAIFVWLKTLWR